MLETIEKAIVYLVFSLMIFMMLADPIHNIFDWIKKKICGHWTRNVFYRLYRLDNTEYVVWFEASLPDVPISVRRASDNSLVPGDKWSAVLFEGDIDSKEDGGYAGESREFDWPILDD